MGARVEGFRSTRPAHVRHVLQQLDGGPLSTVQTTAVSPTGVRATLNVGALHLLVVLECGH